MGIERKFQGEVYRTFVTGLGGYARKKTDIYHALKAMGRVVADQSESGHPDYTVILPPFGFFVEIKGDEKNLAFDTIEPQQREWLDTFVPASWLWIFLGDGQPQWADLSKRPRRAYLVEWAEWKSVERRLEAAGLAGLPYKPHALENRELGLSAGELLADFRLQWVGGQGSRWSIPSNHPLWSHLSYTSKVNKYTRENVEGDYVYPRLASAS